MPHAQATQAPTTDGVYLALGDLLATSLFRFDALQKRAAIPPNERGEKERDLDRLERDLVVWREKMARNKIALHDVLEQARAAPEHVKALSDLIDAVDSKLAVEKADIRRLERHWRRIARSAQQLPLSDGEWIQGLARRALQLATDRHNDRVRAYYDLIALRAEHDPESRGGPTFDSLDALLRYLNAPAA